MNTVTSRKLFIYARKSTDDTQRQVRSIEDQIAELRELARRENVDVAELWDGNRRFATIMAIGLASLGQGLSPNDPGIFIPK